MPEPQTSLTRPIFLAGLLGGLLGGIVAYAAVRTIAPVPPAKTETATQGEPPAEARQLVETFVAKLRSGRLKDLEEEVKRGAWLVSEQEFASFLGQHAGDRARFVAQYGEPGEFEFVRAMVRSPSLVKFVYLEKYQRDGVLWFFVLYHSADAWRLVGVSWKDRLAVAVDSLD
jgi:hypothetical protein